MSALAQLPVTLIVAIVATLFVSLYRKYRKFYLLCWMSAWVLFFVHYVVRDLDTTLLRQSTSLRVVDAFSIQAAAYCLAIAGLRDRVPRRMWLAAGTILLQVLLFDIAWARHITLGAVYLVPIVIGYASVAVAVYMGRKNRTKLHRVVLIASFVIAALLSVFAARDGRLVTVILIGLTLTFAESAVQTWNAFGRRSAGVITTVVALFSCAAVFPLSLLIPFVLPRLPIHPDVWNVPKLFLAVGMLVTLFEDRLAVSETVSKQFRSFFEQAQECILIFDPVTEIILEANPYACRMYGVDRQGLIGAVMRGRTLDVAAGERAIAELKNSGSLINFETVHYRFDGKQIRLLANCRLIDFRGKPAVLAMMRDVTELFASREQVSRLATIVEQSSDAIIWVTPGGTIASWNRGAEQVYGYSAEEAIGKSISMVFVGDRAIDRDLIPRLERGEKVERYETERIRKDGSRIWVSLTASAMRDDAGRFLGVAGVARDVTRRHDAAEEIRKRETRFLNLVERSPFGIAVGCHGGELAMANETFLKLVGYTKEEFAVGNVKWTDLSPVSEVDLDRKAIQEAHLLGASSLYERHYVRKDGTLVPVVVGCVALDDACSDFAVFVADVSQIKNANEEIARLARIVDTTSDAVISIDLNDTILTWNPGAEKLHGFSAPEITGKPAKDLIPPDRLLEWENVRAAVIRGGRLDQFETIRKRSDGSMFPLSMTISPVLDDHGRVVGISKIARDLTEARRAQLLEEQFRQAQKLEALGRLAGGIAHDFNNILMAVSSYAELIRDMVEGDEQLIGFTSQLIKATSRGRSLTQQMLAFGRKQACEQRTVLLSDVVQDTAKMLGRLIGEDIELILRTSKESDFVHVDTGQLMQVVMNLAVNARDAMPTGGTLTISSAVERVKRSVLVSGGEVPPGEYAVLTVADTGCGITDEVKSRIFEPFYTTKEVGKGTGLGLAVVYGIITQCNGHIEIDSWPGRGTTFRIYLPLHQAHTSDIGESDRFVLTSNPGSCSLLLVEDEDSLRESLSVALKAKGYTVFAAAGAVEALHYAADHPGFDVLVSDVVMPRITGYELARTLRQSRPDLPIILMSGYAEGASAALVSDPSLKAEILRKPFPIADLVARIQAVVDPGAERTNQQGTLQSSSVVQ